MKNMNDLKSYLMKIIRQMSNKNITLNATLEELNIPIFEFLQKIRLDINILDNFTKDTIMTLMNTLDTKISFNPNAEDPRDEEIEIYSNILDTSVHYNASKISVNISRKNEDDNYILLKEIGNIITDKITHYEMEATIDKSSISKSTFPGKYPLKHLNIKVTYKTNEKEGTYEFTINEDMILKDLEYIIKCLNNGDFLKPYIILNKYPCSIKIIGQTQKLE